MQLSYDFPTTLDKISETTSFCGKWIKKIDLEKMIL